MTTPKDLYHDLDAPAFNPYAELEAEEQKKLVAYEFVKYLARVAWEDYPPEHRTGCIGGILHAVAEVLIEERGWKPRQAVDALVLEAVRTGGEIERRALADRIKANEARKAVKP